MCGKTVFSFEQNLEKLLKWTAFANSIPQNEVLTPGGYIPLLTKKPDTLELGLSAFRWGFETKREEDGTLSVVSDFFNARVERLDSAPMWRNAYAHQRGAIPMTAFYEHGSQFRSAKGDMLYAAALYKLSPLRLATMVTRPAYDPVTAVHGRMPFLIAESGLDLWCNPNATKGELELFTQFALRYWQPALEIV